jgi:Transposase, Mutator family
LKQFDRAYFALGFAKHFWHHASIGMYFCDGTFTKLKDFKQIVLIATTFDGNNETTILAFAIVDVEDAENWTWFKERLEADFPHSRVWMSDANKGIRSNRFSLSMSQSTSGFVLSRCARHLAENCRDACKGSMNEDHKRMIIELAKSRTEEMYKKRLASIKAINKQWSEYLDKHKDEFVTYCFLDDKVGSFGKVTSNGVETINGALLEERSMPILFMIEVMIKYQ